MMWVCRAGRDSKYYKFFIENKCIYLPWEGFRVNLSNRSSVADFRMIVATEKKTDNRVTISNLACQLDYFCNKISNGDYVLIPSFSSQSYALCQVIGEYKYNDIDILPHCRPIEVLQTDIQRNIFPQSIIYSLGTFRTIFRVKDEDKVLKIIKDASN